MKRLLVLTALALTSFGSMAQKANIQSAINYLKDKDIANAKKMIDEATKNESTINNSKAWFLKGLIYQAIGTPKSEQMPFITFNLSSTNGVDQVPIILDDANKFLSQHPNALDESFEAYKKSIELNSKYDKNEYLILLQYIIYAHFNNGVTLMNDNKFNDGYSAFGKIAPFKSLDNGKLFAGLGQFDTLFSNARMYQASCAFQTDKNDEALAIAEECLKNPITQTLDLYRIGIEISERKRDDAKWTQFMKEAKAKFPKNKILLNNEIIYYQTNNKLDVLIKSLKEGVEADPSNADNYISLAEAYNSMANPMEKGKALAKPENAKELEQNAMTNGLKAVELAPKNSYAHFFMGLLYYNKAKEVTDEMNKADDKKYAAMKPERDALIEKSIPFLEKAKSLFEGEGINDSNKDNYKNALSGLSQLNMLMNKSEKSAEYLKLLEGVR